LIAAFVLTNVLAVHIFGSEFNGNDSATSASYTTDLTQLGREGRLRQSPNFETEINKVLEVLAKGGSRQPVVVDENGSIQDEIVEQIAIRLAKGSVPASLQNHSLVKLETTALYSNTLDTAARTAAFEKILGTVLGSKGQTVLFVEDVTTFVDRTHSSRLFVMERSRSSAEARSQRSTKRSHRTASSQASSKLFP
jgi:ATP-dependent Clp protease ATP-binding subunit ClpA